MHLKGFPIDLVSVNNIGNNKPSQIQLLDTGTEFIYDFAAPIVIGESRVGTGRIGLSKKIIQQEVNRLILTIVALSAGTLLLAILLGALFGRWVTTRLDILKKSVEEMVEGNLDNQTGPLLKRNCWEIMNCTLKEKCPAYGDSRRRCWYVAGTMCEQCDHTVYPAKLKSCRTCPVYQENVGDEIQDLAETFDVMALNLKTHITEIKNYQAQLVQSQKMDAIGQMAAGVAHEINTPLGIILGYAQLLQDDIDPEDSMMEELQVIERQAKVCRKIVADLLNFSRQTETAKREMSINNSLLETISLVEHTFSMSKVLLKTDLGEENNIVGDPDKLKQVWINFFNNARDAMSDGGIILVKSRMDTEKNRMVISVADTGPGISEGNMKKIFDPFFTTKSVGKGTGLGLSVSFGIIEDHSGTIRAQSPLPSDLNMTDFGDIEPIGPGTVFVVEIPA